MQPGTEQHVDCVATMLALIEADPTMDEAETKAAVAVVAKHAQDGDLHTAESYYALALYYTEQQSFEGAEEAYRSAIALKPEWSRPHNGLGVLLANHTEGRAEEAEEAYRTAIRLEPEWSRPHNDLAILLRLTGRLDEAQQEALTALRYGPDSVATHNNYANLLVKQGRLDEAEPFYLKAIRLDSEHPKPYYNLACLYSLQGKKEQVYPLLNKAITLDERLRAEAQKDPDFETLREDPEFGKILTDAPPRPNLER